MIFFRTVHRRFFFLALFFALPASSESIAVSLGDYDSYIFIHKIVGIPDTNISGAVFNSDTRTVYAVDDKSCSIYELDQGGNLLRTITTNGFSNFEGISRYKGNHYFLAEEDPTHSDIVFAAIPTTGNGPVHRKDGWVDTLGVDWSNSGLEGVSWCASDSKLFAAKQKDPSELYEISLDTAGRPRSIAQDQPFKIESKSDDVSDIFALSDGNFLVVNANQLKLFGYTPDGRLLSSLDLTGMKKPEGLAVDEIDGTLYVVGESREFYVFKRRTAIKSDRHQAPTLSVFQTSGSLGQTVRFVLPQAHPQPVQIDLFSIDGKRTATFRIMANTGTNSLAIPAHCFSSSIKLCRITAGSMQFVAKVIPILGSGQD